MWRLIHQARQEKGTGVIRDAVKDAVPINETMVPELLKKRRGFDSHYGYYTGNEEYWNHTSPAWSAGSSMVYSTNLFSSAIERVIAAHDAAVPLFVYAAFGAPRTCVAVHGASSCYVEGGAPN
eukprot:gene36000-66676_t